MRTDTEFHDFARAFPRAFLLLVSGKAPLAPYVPESVTLKRVETRIDLVFRPEGEAEGDWWVIECHGYDDPGVERRLYLEAVCLASEQDAWQRIRTAIIYTERRFAERALPARLGPPDSPAELAPERIVLAEKDPESLLALGPELFPLIPLSRATRDQIKRNVERWYQSVQHSLCGKSATIEKLGEQFLRFCASRFPDDSIELVERLLEKVMDIKNTRVGQDLIQIGEQRGEERGIAIGEERGEKRTLIATTCRILQERFGRVPEHLAADLEEIDDLDCLRELPIRAMNAADLARFEGSL